MIYTTNSNNNTNNHNNNISSSSSSDINSNSNSRRVGFNIGTLLSMEEILKFSKLADSSSSESVDSLWVPESWGRESFFFFFAISQITNRLKIGTSILSIFSRSPSTTIMGGVTMDILSHNRTILGLGVSTPALVENWHGRIFKKPIQHMREYVKCIRLINSGEKVSFNGDFFRINNFKILENPPRKNIPIYLAAVNKGMISLATEIADGILLYLQPISNLKNIVSYINKMKNNNNNNSSDNPHHRFEICSAFITAVSDKYPDMARNRAAKTLAFYCAVGKFYSTFLSKHGYYEEINTIINHYRKYGLEKIENEISEKMLEDLTICGSKEECIKKLDMISKCGITLPILQINPIERPKNDNNYYNRSSQIMEILSIV